MSYTTVSSDSFTGADAPLRFRVLDNAAGGTEGSNTWEQAFGADFETSSNRAVNTDATGIHLAAVLSTAAVADCQVSGLSYGVGSAIVARFDSTGLRWYMFNRDVSASQFYYFDGASFNLVDASGPAITDGQKVAIAPEGGQIKCLVDDVVVISQPHAAIASGKPGIYSGGGGTGFDNFKYETGTASVVTATHLTITTAPVGNQSGVNFTTQPVAAVRDAGESTVTSDTSTVTATLNTLSGSGTLGGTTAVAAVAGVATFTNLKVTGTGRFTITFSDGALATAVTAAFYVGATKLAITSQPTTAFSKRVHGNVVVAVRDPGNATVGNATNSVTIALTVISGIAVLSAGTLTRAAVAGVATFNDLAVTCSEGAIWTYAVSASGLTGDTSSPITGSVSVDIAVTIT